MMFSLVNVARLASLDAEEALQRAIKKFRRRFITIEDDARKPGGHRSPRVRPKSWSGRGRQSRRRPAGR